MRVLFITTESNEIPKYAESIESLGHEVSTWMFRHSIKHQPPANIDDEVRTVVSERNPQLIVYVGACGACTKPSVEVITHLNKTVAPTVLICSDAADEESPWWDELREYDKNDSFRVIVAIDGNKEWPLADKHITALTPINPKWFGEPIPHAQRKMKLGFAGNIGQIYKVKGLNVGRKLLLDQMAKLGLQSRQRDQTILDSTKADQTYREMCEFMKDCCMTPNFAETGSFQRKHVKGRVVEAGLAGCMLFETMSSPAKDWFFPSEDYIEYKGIKDFTEYFNRYVNDPEETERFGRNLRGRVLQDHSPEKFWGRILERL